MQRRVARHRSRSAAACVPGAGSADGVAAWLERAAGQQPALHCMPGGAVASSRRHVTPSPAEVRSDLVVGSGIGDDWRAVERERGLPRSGWWSTGQAPGKQAGGPLGHLGDASADRAGWAGQIGAEAPALHQPNPTVADGGATGGLAKRRALIGTAAMNHLVDNPPTSTLAPLLRRQGKPQGARPEGPGGHGAAPSNASWSVPMLSDAIGSMCRENAWLPQE